MNQESGWETDSSAVLYYTWLSPFSHLFKDKHFHEVPSADGATADLCSCVSLLHRCYRLHLPARQPVTRLCEVFSVVVVPGQGKEIAYSCLTERERVALTLLIDRFTRLCHLAVWLHPLRCKKRQMWYLASFQYVSFPLSPLFKVRIRNFREQSLPSVSENTVMQTEEALWKHNGS